jgi:hypothetical protein
MKHLAILGTLLVLQSNVLADPAPAAVARAVQLGPQLLGAGGSTLYTAHTPALPGLVGGLDLDAARVALGAEVTHRGDWVVNTLVLSPSLQAQPQPQPDGVEVLVSIGCKLR